MEFIKIGDCGIKISLGAKEAAEYNITEGMVCEEKDIRRSFSRLLDMAKRELGIKLPNGQLLAEVFSSRDGGYEIFVSYINGENETRGAEKQQKTAFLINSSDALLYIKERLDALCEDYEIYIYEATQKYYLIVKNIKRGDVSLGFLYELASPLRQSNARCIQAYAKKLYHN